MLKHILVPLDGSSFGEQALPLALEIARRSGAELHLVQVHVPQDALAYPGGGPPAYEPRFEADLRAREEERLRGLAERAAAENGVVARAVLLEGPVVPMLGKHAAEIGVDLVVMPTHARGGIRRAFAGSVADSLIRASRLPVLAIRTRGSTEKGRSRIQRILVPLDGSGFSEHALASAEALAQAMGAAFTLLYVLPRLLTTPDPIAPGWPYGEEAKEQVRSMAAAYLHAQAERLRERGFAVDAAIIMAEDTAAAIRRFAARNDVDLVAMATHGRGGWSRAVLGSVADKVLRSANVPVLLVRPDVDLASGHEPQGAAVDNA